MKNVSLGMTNAFQRSQIRGVGQFVDVDNRHISRLDQATDERRADEARTASDDNDPEHV
jgi:hypothetical protein